MPSTRYLLLIISKVVDRDSAILGLAGDRELAFGIAADHSNICRFEAEDNSNYEVVSKNLKELVENAIKHANEIEAQATPTTPATRVSAVVEAVSKSSTALYISPCVYGQSVPVLFSPHVS